MVYHFLWPWPWCGVTWSVQNKTCWLNFLTHFGVVMNQFKVSSLILLLKDYWIKEITVVILTVSKSFMVIQTDLVQTWYDDRHYWSLHFETILSDIDLDQGHKDARKQNLLHLLCDRVLNGSGWDLVCCWNVPVWWSSFSFVLSDQYLGKKTQFRWFHHKAFSVCVTCHLDVYEPVLYILVWW